MIIAKLWIIFSQKDNKLLMRDLNTCFLLCLLLLSISSKQFSSDFSIKQFKLNKGWSYIGKMVLQPGIAEVSLSSSKTSGQAFGTDGQVIMDIVEEQEWVQNGQDQCGSRIKSPLLLHPLYFDGRTSTSSTQVQVEREQYYYFVLKDCRSQFLMDYSNEKMRFSILLEVTNSGSSMGAEEDHWLILPVIIAIGLWLLFSDKQFLRGEFQYDPDYAKMILFAGIATNVSSLIWRSFGYIIYFIWGVNFQAFHLVYLFMHAVSETIVIGLLMLIGFGWSINFAGASNMDLAIPAFSFVAVVNILATLLTQLGNSSHDMHHTFDAVAGNVLILTRLLTALAFLAATCWTYSHSRFQVKRFIAKFGLLGSLYLMSLPIVVGAANRAVEARERAEFVFVALESVKTVGNIALMRMVSSKKSEYSAVNVRNSSFLEGKAGFL